MIKSVHPWSRNTECPLEGFSQFKEDLLRASFHNAAEGAGEDGQARSCTRAAAEVAIDNRWPYWAIERMFNEISPLVTWSTFMSAYIDLLYNGYQLERS
jgi:hypothetical protein